VDQLNPTLVDTRGLSMHTTNVPVDTLVSPFNQMWWALLICVRVLVSTILWSALRRKRGRSCSLDHNIHEMTFAIVYI
jgi:hypothetical protein